MLILTAKDILMEYGDKPLFHIDNINIDSTDRIGVVGVNGCGKSTLLKILSQNIEPLSGNVTLHAQMAYIPQLDDSEESQTILDKQREYWGIPLNPKSGGEKTRLKIARALGRESGIMLCDEPTSNLDQDGIARLEDALKVYEGALILVSHDRMLLENQCNTIWEIDDGSFKVYSGGYKSYRTQKEIERKQAETEYEVYMDKKNQLENALSDRNRRAKMMKNPPKRMGNSEARLHRMEVRTRAAKVEKSAVQIKHRLKRLDVKEKPQPLPKVNMTGMDIHNIGGKTAINIQNLNFAYDDNMILKDIDLLVSAGDRIAITGSNGSGKTTLMNCIYRNHEGVWTPPAARIEYFRQDHTDLSEDKTAIDCIMETSKLPLYMARTIMARLGLERAIANKKIHMLSGGERCRISLTRILSGQAPILMLDEPTNYLDVYAMEALEEMLVEFGGTVLFVSHDRYFREECKTKEVMISNGHIKVVEQKKALPKPKQTYDKMMLEFERDKLSMSLSSPRQGDDLVEMEKRYMEIVGILKNL